MKITTWLLLLFIFGAALFVMPASALTQYNITQGSDNIVIFNGTAGSTTWTVPAGVTNLTYLVVAGGGGGAGDIAAGVGGGGGGAGGFATNSSINVTTLGGSPLTVVVGAGGAGGSGRGDGGQARGGNSSLGNVIAYGGGKGLGYGGTVSDLAGSGGGGAGLDATASPGTAYQGNDGTASVTFTGGGGGGGANQPGKTPTSGYGAAGGRGRLSNITGSPVWYSGGGGGSAESGGGAPGAGGLGGGGASAAGTGVAGTINTGGGGGGTNVTGTGGAGGAGIVVISYKIVPTPTTVGTNDKLYTFGGNPGTVLWTAPADCNKVWLTIIGGGGGGGGATTGASGQGGGGAGGFVNLSTTVTPGSTYLIQVGQGGQGGLALAGGWGRNGTNSVFNNIVSYYGGGGGSAGTGFNGSSAGGGANGFAGALALTTVPSAQGRNGGNGGGAANYPGGGGGGATAAGTAATGTNAGAGGNGNTSAITGSSVTYAGGGGGGGDAGATAAGGTGGGGAGAVGASGLVVSGTNNLGGGGGGADSLNPTMGGDGGSGIVLLRYTPLAFPIAQFTQNVTSGNAPLAVQFTNQSITAISQSQWNFTPNIGTGLGNRSNVPNPVFTFWNAGTYPVTLNVTNASGFWNSTSTNIVVTLPSAPVAGFTANATFGTVPFPVFFNDTSTGGLVSNWSWTYSRNGAANVTFGANRTATYTFTNIGTYRIFLNVSNPGGFSEATTTISARGLGAPIAAFAVSPDSGSPGVLISFGDQTSFSGGITGTPNLTYNWTFDDPFSASPYSETVGDVQHVYSSVGLYSPSLTVTNDNGTSTFTLNNGIVVSTNQQTQTVFYSPNTVILYVRNTQNMQFAQGYTVNATFNRSTLPQTTLSWLVSNYGMNAVAANEALNGTLIMGGKTDSTGGCAFMMQPSLQYDIVVSDTSGHTNTYTLSPRQAGAYYLNFDATNGAVSDSFYDDIVSAGNTWTRPYVNPNDLNNFTTMFSFQDMTSYTTKVDFIVTDQNSTIIFITNQSNPIAGGVYRVNYTMTNTRGNQIYAFQNISRSV